MKLLHPLVHDCGWADNNGRAEPGIPANNHRTEMFNLKHAARMGTEGTEDSIKFGYGQQNTFLNYRQLLQTHINKIKYVFVEYSGMRESD